MKRIISMGLACLVLVASTFLPVSAAEVNVDCCDSSLVMPFATNSFNITVPAKSKCLADTSFSLAAGETVTIKASYSPFSASVDFGLVAPDGTFYYYTVTGGNIDKTIQVSISGNYTFQVRNNSDSAIQVLGFLNY